MRASVRMTRYLESWGAVKPFAHLQSREGYTTDTMVNGKLRCKVSDGWRGNCIITDEKITMHTSSKRNSPLYTSSITGWNVLLQASVFPVEDCCDCWWHIYWHIHTCCFTSCFTLLLAVLRTMCITTVVLKKILGHPSAHSSLEDHWEVRKAKSENTERMTRALNWHHVRVVTSDSPYWSSTPAMHQSVDTVGVYGCGGVFRKPVLFLNYQMQTTDQSLYSKC